MLQKLYTKRGEELAGAPWQVYPRPQMRRESYVNLNGQWDLTVGDDACKITVPFCPESQLSGVNRHFGSFDILVYNRKFTLPQDFNRGRVLLHIGAADQDLVCCVNEKEIGSHHGGYTAMTFDITAALQPGENEMKLAVWDRQNSLSYPYGKQTEKRGGMWYTPVSGIWQTVWLESVPETYIEDLDIQVDLETAIISTTPP